MANKHLAARFVRLCEATGWTYREIARRVNCDSKTASNWATASRTIPPEILQWLEDCAAALRKLEAPDYQTLRPISGRQPAKENA